MNSSSEDIFDNLKKGFTKEDSRIVNNVLEGNFPVNEDVIHSLRKILERVVLPSDSGADIEGVRKILQCLLCTCFLEGRFVWEEVHLQFVMMIRLCLNFITIIADNRDAFFNLSTTILELISVSSKQSKVVKNCMVKVLSTPVLDLMLKNEIHLLVRRNICKTFNNVLSGSDSSLRKEFVNPLRGLLCKLASLLITCGDYEFQTAILELIFRFIAIKSDRQPYRTWFCEYPDIENAFVNIAFKDFDPDCRTFLNIVNSSQGSTGQVHTFPCVKAFVDNREIFKPKEENYKELWVDFNYGSSCMIILCDSSSLIPDKAVNSWEVVCVPCDLVTQATFRFVGDRMQTLVLKVDGEKKTELLTLNPISAKEFHLTFSNPTAVRSLASEVLPHMLGNKYQKVPVSSDTTFLKSSGHKVLQGSFPNTRRISTSGVTAVINSHLSKYRPLQIISSPMKHNGTGKVGTEVVSTQRTPLTLCTNLPSLPEGSPDPRKDLKQRLKTHSTNFASVAPSVIASPQLSMISEERPSQLSSSVPHVSDTNNLNLTTYNSNDTVNLKDVDGHSQTQKVNSQRKSSTTGPASVIIKNTNENQFQSPTSDFRLKDANIVPKVHMTKISKIYRKSSVSEKIDFDRHSSRSELQQVKRLSNNTSLENNSSTTNQSLSRHFSKSEEQAEILERNQKEDSAISGDSAGVLNETCCANEQNRNSEVLLKKSKSKCKASATKEAVTIRTDERRETCAPADLNESEKGRKANESSVNNAHILQKCSEVYTEHRIPNRKCSTSMSTGPITSQIHGSDKITDSDNDTRKILKQQVTSSDRNNYSEFHKSGFISSTEVLTTKSYSSGDIAMPEISNSLNIGALGEPGNNDLLVSEERSEGERNKNSEITKQKFGVGVVTYFDRAKHTEKNLILAKPQKTCDSHMETKSVESLDSHQPSKSVEAHGKKKLLDEISSMAVAGKKKSLDINESSESVSVEIHVKKKSVTKKESISSVKTHGKKNTPDTNETSASLEALLNVLDSQEAATNKQDLSQFPSNIEKSIHSSTETHRKNISNKAEKKNEALKNNVSSRQDSSEDENGHFQPKTNKKYNIAKKSKQKIVNRQEKKVLQDIVQNVDKKDKEVVKDKEVKQNVPVEGRKSLRLRSKSREQQAHTEFQYETILKEQENKQIEKFTKENIKNRGRRLRQLPLGKNENVNAPDSDSINPAKKAEEDKEKAMLQTLKHERSKAGKENEIKSSCAVNTQKQIVTQKKPNRTKRVHKRNMKEEISSSCVEDKKDTSEIRLQTNQLDKSMVQNNDSNDVFDIETAPTQILLHSSKPSSVNQITTSVEMPSAKEISKVSSCSKLKYVRNTLQNENNSSKEIEKIPENSEINKDVTLVPETQTSHFEEDNISEDPKEKQTISKRNASSSVLETHIARFKECLSLENTSSDSNKKTTLKSGTSTNIQEIQICSSKKDISLEESSKLSKKTLKQSKLIVVPETQTASEEAEQLNSRSHQKQNISSEKDIYVDKISDFSCEEMNSRASTATSIKEIYISKSRKEKALLEDNSNSLNNTFMRSELVVVPETQTDTEKEAKLISRSHKRLQENSVKSVSELFTAPFVKETSNKTTESVVSFQGINIGSDIENVINNKNTGRDETFKARGPRNSSEYTAQHILEDWESSNDTLPDKSNNENIKYTSPEIGYRGRSEILRVRRPDAELMVNVQKYLSVLHDKSELKTTNSKEGTNSNGCIEKQLLSPDVSAPKDSESKKSENRMNDYRDIHESLKETEHVTANSSNTSNLNVGTSQRYIQRVKSPMDTEYSKAVSNITTVEQILQDWGTNENDEFNCTNTANVSKLPKDKMQSSLLKKSESNGKNEKIPDNNKNVQELDKILLQKQKPGNTNKNMELPQKDDQHQSSNKNIHLSSKVFAGKHKKSENPRENLEPQDVNRLQDHGNTPLQPLAKLHSPANINSNVDVPNVNELQVSKNVQSLDKPESSLHKLDDTSKKVDVLSDNQSKNQKVQLLEINSEKEGRTQIIQKTTSIHDTQASSKPNKERSRFSLQKMNEIKSLIDLKTRRYEVDKQNKEQRQSALNLLRTDQIKCIETPENQNEDSHRQSSRKRKLYSEPKDSQEVIELEELENSSCDPSWTPKRPCGWKRRRLFSSENKNVEKKIEPKKRSRTKKASEIQTTELKRRSRSKIDPEIQTYKFETVSIPQLTEFSPNSTSRWKSKFMKEIGKHKREKISQENEKYKNKHKFSIYSDFESDSSSNISWLEPLKTKPSRVLKPKVTYEKKKKLQLLCKTRKEKNMPTKVQSTKGSSKDSKIENENKYSSSGWREFEIMRDATENTDDVMAPPEDDILPLRGNAVSTLDESLPPLVVEVDKNPGYNWSYSPPYIIIEDEIDERVETHEVMGNLVKKTKKNKNHTKNKSEISENKVKEKVTKKTAEDIEIKHRENMDKPKRCDFSPVRKEKIKKNNPQGRKHNSFQRIQSPGMNSLPPEKNPSDSKKTISFKNNTELGFHYKDSTQKSNPIIDLTPEEDNAPEEMQVIESDKHKSKKINYKSDINADLGKKDCLPEHQLTSAPKNQQLKKKSSLYSGMKNSPSIQKDVLENSEMYSKKSLRKKSQENKLCRKPKEFRQTSEEDYISEQTCSKNEKQPREWPSMHTFCDLNTKELQSDADLFSSMNISNSFSCNVDDFEEFCKEFAESIHDDSMQLSNSVSVNDMLSESTAEAKSYLPDTEDKDKKSDHNDLKTVTSETNTKQKKTGKKHFCETSINLPECLETGNSALMMVSEKKQKKKKHLPLKEANYPVDSLVSFPESNLNLQKTLNVPSGNLTPALPSERINSGMSSLENIQAPMTENVLTSQWSLIPAFKEHTGSFQLLSNVIPFSNVLSDNEDLISHSTKETTFKKSYHKESEHKDKNLETLPTGTRKKQKKNKKEHLDDTNSNIPEWAETGNDLAKDTVASLMVPEDVKKRKKRPHSKQVTNPINSIEAVLSEIDVNSQTMPSFKEPSVSLEVAVPPGRYDFGMSSVRNIQNPLKDNNISSQWTVVPARKKNTNFSQNMEDLDMENWNLASPHLNQNEESFSISECIDASIATFSQNCCIQNPQNTSHSFSITCEEKEFTKNVDLDMLSCKVSKAGKKALLKTKNKHEIADYQSPVHGSQMIPFSLEANFNSNGDIQNVKSLSQSSVNAIRTMKETAVPSCSKDGKPQRINLDIPMGLDDDDSKGIVATCQLKKKRNYKDGNKYHKKKSKNTGHIMEIPLFEDTTPVVSTSRHTQDDISLDLESSQAVEFSEHDEKIEITASTPWTIMKNRKSQQQELLRGVCEESRKIIEENFKDVYFESCKKRKVLVDGYLSKEEQELKKLEKNIEYLNQQEARFQKLEKYIKHTFHHQHQCMDEMIESNSGIQNIQRNFNKQWKKTERDLRKMPEKSREVLKEQVDTLIDSQLENESFKDMAKLRMKMQAFLGYMGNADQ